MTAVAAAALLCACGASWADPVAISPAETLLFMTPHLKAVQVPGSLHYSFRKRGTLEQGFSDTIDIDLRPGPDGTLKGSTRFFSGKRRIDYPGVDNAEGNPVLLFYLEREIREMSRLTGGVPSHFRLRIRQALADSAQMKDVDIPFGGRRVRAQQITIAPYETDPNKDRFARLARKQYTFIMCEAVPGFVYEVRGLVPAAGGSPKDAPVLDETVTFKSAGPLK